jgi:hypothetical protein
MPVGSSAQYVAADLTGTLITVDEEPIILSPSSPLRPLWENDQWPANCQQTGSVADSVPVPDGYTVPEGNASFMPNYAGGVLKADGRTIIELQYATRCGDQGPLTAGIVRSSHDIYGSGVGFGVGGHGGSSLSGVGGSLRVWEAESDVAIQHALKVVLPVGVLSGTNGGYRWPAQNADSGYNDPSGWAYYAGSNGELRMGALLALAPGVNIDGLGLQTAMGKRLAKALQDYGAYVVDAHPNTWSPLTWAAEYGVEDALWSRYGYNLESGALQADSLKLFKQLSVVTNNTSSSVGGGGTPRQPLLPPIGN